MMDMSYFIEGFIKRAAQNSTQGERDRVKALGAASSLGGGVLIKGSIPKLTGRTTLYHGTRDDLAPKILKEGILPGKGGIADMLDEDLKANKYTYMDPRKNNAKTYAHQAEALADFRRKNPHLSPQESVKKFVETATLSERVAPFFGGRGTVIEGSVPLWKLEDKGHIIKNPELLGASNPAEFRKRYHKKYHELLFPGTEDVLYESLDVPTFKGPTPSKYLKGSTNYKRVGLGELKQYIKARPKIFAKGLGLASLGALGLTYGANKLKDGFKKSP